MAEIAHMGEWNDGKVERSCEPSAGMSGTRSAVEYGSARFGMSRWCLLRWGLGALWKLCVINGVTPYTSRITQDEGSRITQCNYEMLQHIFWLPSIFSAFRCTAVPVRHHFTTRVSGHVASHPTPDVTPHIPYMQKYYD